MTEQHSIKFFVTTFLAGAAFGLMEALVTVLRVSGLNGSERHFLLLAGALLYGVATTLLAGGWVLLNRLFKRKVETNSSIVALSIAATTMLGAQLVANLMRLRDPRLAWLLPACIITAVVCGILLYRILQRGPLIRKIMIWSLWLIPVCLLVYGIVTGRFDHGSQKDAGSRPNILLISIDTLRSDHLGAYGDSKARTPSIDKLAREGILFEDATTPVPITGPAHISMLTGLYPSRHGARENGVRLPANRATISDLLANEGYRTGAFVSGWTLKDLAAGLAGHFDYYDENFSTVWWFPDHLRELALPGVTAGAATLLFKTKIPLERNADRTTQKASEWLSRQKKSGHPFFLFVHYFDPHAPYQPPDPYEKLHLPNYTGDRTVYHWFQPAEVKKRIVQNPRHTEYIKALYRGEISYTDAAIGRLLETVRSQGLEQNTIVLFTADHGESLTEHDFYFDHGEFLYDTCVRVPLIIRFPGSKYAGTRVINQVSLVDIAPTIAEMVRIKVPQGDGRSLVNSIERKPDSERPTFGALRMHRREDMEARFYVRAGGFKLIWNFDVRATLSAKPLSEELYNIRTDPGETKNIYQTAPPEIVDFLRTQMRRWSAEGDSSYEPPSEEVKERLRSLGYF